MKYVEGLYYHIYNRGSRKERIFFQDENYLYLKSLFLKNSERYDVVVAAYCLMPNHYHLVLRQERNGSISSFLRTTFNTYVQGINSVFEKSGTLFEGQAKAKHITTNDYCVKVIRYIHLNPVTSGLVSSPDNLRFSNYLEWVDRRYSPLIDMDLRSAFFPDGRAYEQYVRDYLKEKVEAISQSLFDDES